MNSFSVKLILFTLLLISSGVLLGADTEKKGKVRIKYKKHTQFDFSGNRIQGAVKTPAVFYIFQRKRAKEHHVISAVESFDHHHQTTLHTIEEVLQK
ncbi:MAG: hypothetical protein ACOCUH_02990 [Bacteriovoracia bacterium]